MTTAEKKQQLQKHKRWATGLFLLMTILFIVMIYFIKSSPKEWMYYVKAFAEAAMVGALADWFAVTALFHYPLGLKIPHTNLIQNSKQKIGDNLGDFVVDNFITSENIRPYISKLDIAQFIAQWLQKDKNKNILATETSHYLRKIIIDLDDQFIINIITNKGKEFIDALAINELLGNGLDYVLDKNMQQQLITFLATKLKNYIAENEEMVKEKVKSESSILIPGFVDNLIAKKITNGLSKYFNEIEIQSNHPIRNDITKQLRIIANDLRSKPEWKSDINKLKNELLASNQSHKMATDIWFSVKNNFISGLDSSESGIKNYINKTINDIANSFENEQALKDKINNWIRINAYKIVLKNKNGLGTLISQTVGNWEGKSLSEKLELEVGKDLQFIRINGTLVGGIVGLLIYTLSQLLF